MTAHNPEPWRVYQATFAMKDGCRIVDGGPSSRNFAVFAGLPPKSADAIARHLVAQACVAFRCSPKHLQLLGGARRP